MYCSKCGCQNQNGEQFCKNCGILLESNQFQQQFNNVNNMNVQNGQPMNNLNQNYVNQAINPNMKKWAILSIVMAVVAIVWYWFIGLTVYLAIVIAAAGFSFAQKAEASDKKLATVGKVANGILVGIAIVMLVLQLINALSK